MNRIALAARDGHPLAGYRFDPLNAPKASIVIAPAQFGLKRIGHFGFFKPQSEAALWPIVTAWIEEKTAT